MLMLDTAWIYFGLDRLWTKHALYATLVWLLSPTQRYRTVSRQILNLTNFRQNPDLMAHSTDIGHCLDNNGIWTYSGLIMDLLVCMLIFHFLLIDLGKRLNINWTRHTLDPVFQHILLGLLSPFTFHGQNWDRLSTWTNSGQNPDLMAHQLLGTWKDVNWALPKYHGPLLTHLPPTHGPLKTHLKTAHGRLQPSHGPLAAHPWPKTRLDGQPSPWDMEDINWALPEQLIVNTQSTHGPLLVHKVYDICEWELKAKLEWHKAHVLSRVCLVQNVSRKCPTSAFVNTEVTPLDNLWTSAGFSCPIVVQRPLTWTGSLHQLDSDWTDPVLSQLLDRPWTENRQTLDKSWILCPGSVQPLSNHPLLRRTALS